MKGYKIMRKGNNMMMYMMMNMHMMMCPFEMPK